MVCYEPSWRTRVRVAPAIVLTDGERAELMKLVRAKRTSVRLALRARIVLLAASGGLNKDMSRGIGARTA